MQGRKIFQPKTFYSVNLLDMVPKDNYYRQLDSLLDLQFLYLHTKDFYGHEGQQSIDPVVFFKLLMVGYLNNIQSDRALIDFCSNRLDIRLFLHYDIDEALPWHSTISRTRSLYGEAVFLQLFQKVLALCVSKGMVKGKRQAIDSAYVKANASLDSLQEKEVVEDAASYADELNEGSEFKVALSKAKEVEKHHDWKREAYKTMPGHGKKDAGRKDEFGNEIRPKFLSNHTHYSPTDPDAKISVKPGKARQLNYFAQLAVDDANHVITGALAAKADQRDSQCLPDILAQTITNLQQHDLVLEEIAADAGYSSSDSLQYCHLRGVDAWMPNFGQFKGDREGFYFNKDLNQYECQRGNRAIIPFRKTITDTKGYTKHIYRSGNSLCKDCPLRKNCIGKSDFKKIEDATGRHYFEAMDRKLKANPQKARAMSRMRSRTVEPVLGTLINFMNMKRVNTRGIKLANKHIIMAALCYNLQKLLKFNPKTGLSKALEKDCSGLNACFLGFKLAFYSALVLCAAIFQLENHKCLKPLY